MGILSDVNWFFFLDASSGVFFDQYCASATRNARL